MDNEAKKPTRKPTSSVESFMAEHPQWVRAGLRAKYRWAEGKQMTRAAFEEAVAQFKNGSGK